MPRAATNPLSHLTFSAQLEILIHLAITIIIDLITALRAAHARSGITAQALTILSTDIEPLDTTSPISQGTGLTQL